AQDPLNTPPAVRQKNLAKVGQALCLANLGKPQEALPILQQVIAEVDSQDQRLFAAAYSALGFCHQRMEQPMDAVVAYLHVHLLFPQDSRLHAEALYHLAELWPQVGEPEKGEQAKQLLATRYANSPWAQRAK